MRVTFAGVGEAFDENLPNTSILVESETSSILLDCGFTAPSGFWKAAENPLELDMVYISHFHADHYFGLPALLVRSVQEGRSKRLTILGPNGIEGRVTRLVEMAYSNVLANANFELFFVECNPGEEFRHAGFNFQFAMGDHPMPCLAIRLESNDKCMFYSGDGCPTEGTRALAQGCDLIVHDAFTLDQEKPGHCSVKSALEFARDVGAKACALVHVDREVRLANKGVIMTRARAISGLDGFLPEPGDIYEL